VEQIISAIMQFLQQGIVAIFKFLELVWTWSFGEIIAIFHSDWKALPIWKLVVLVAVVAAIAYVLYKTVMVLWEAAVAVFAAFVALLSAFVSVLPYIVAAGLIVKSGPGLNVAVTDVSELTVIVQLLGSVPTHAPLQPPNTEFPETTAVRDTDDANI